MMCKSLTCGTGYEGMNGSQGAAEASCWKRPGKVKLQPQLQSRPRGHEEAEAWHCEKLPGGW